MRLSPIERDSLHRSLRERLVKGQAIAATIHRALAERIWEGRIDQRGREWKYDSFVAYLTAQPPGGLSQKLDDVRPMILADNETLRLFDEAVQRPPYIHARDDVDNVHVTPRPTGNSKQAGIRRLRKAAASDERAAELLRLVASHEMSTNAACVAMGWRKKPCAFDRVVAAYRKLDADERERFRSWLSGVGQ